MVVDSNEKSSKPVRDYFTGKKCLIANSVSSIRSSFRKVMTNLGVQGADIMVVDSFAGANEILGNSDPNIIFIDYEFKNHSGMELLETHLEKFANRIDACFFLVSSVETRAIASTVLDYEVDAFFTEPFTLQSIEEKVLKALESKIRPKNSTKFFERGKMQFRLGNDKEALNCFLKIKKSRPSDSLYYEGMILKKMGQIEKAETGFKEGLAIDSKHYLCLKGLAELYHESNRLKESYQQYLEIIKHYPVHPDKIPALTKLSIASGQFEDVADYCDQLTQLTNPSDELKRNISAGLAICGKYLCSHNQKDRGIEILEKSAKYSSGDIKILKSVISSLISVNSGKKALQILQEISGDAEDQVNFDIMHLEILNATTESSNDILTLGGELIRLKVNDPIVYQIVIEHSVKINRKTDIIEELVFEAGKLFPEQKSFFESLVKKAS